MGDWGRAGQGALGGAATGAAVGSVAGPWGAAIGGAVGGIAGGALGFFGGDDAPKTVDPYQFDPSQWQFQATAAGDQYRQQAAQYTNRYDPAMLAMFNQGVDRNQAAAMSSAISNQNLPPALAERLALDAQNKLGLQSQAQLSAMEIQQQQNNDQMVRYFMSLGYNMDEAQLKANMMLQQSQAQSYYTSQGMDWQTQMAEWQHSNDVANSWMAAGGAMAGGMLGRGGGLGGGAAAPTAGGGQLTSVSLPGEAPIAARSV